MNEHEKNTRRAKGDGTVKELPNGMLQLQISFGYDKKGKRIRKTVVGRNKTELNQKKFELIRQFDPNKNTKKSHLC